MLAIEILENRIAPAGIITVSFEKGALTLSADGNEDHSFSVTALDPWTVEVRATDDTLFKMGDDAPTDTLILTSPLKSLTATLGDGADNVSLVGLSIAGDVKINSGAGENTLNFNTLFTKGGLQVTGGEGSDTVNMAGTISVKKDVLLGLGDGSNSLAISGESFQAGGTLSYTGGNGWDSFTVMSGGVSVGKDLSLNFGAGGSEANVMAIGTFNVGKNLLVDTSASLTEDSSSFSLMALSTRIGGDVRITDGAGSSNINLATTGSIGKISVVTGEGSSGAILGYLQLKTKAIDFNATASSGSSLMVIGLGTSGSAPAINYTGGPGSDALTAVGLGGASVTAKMGDGDNQAIVANLGGSSKAITVTGGSGTDSVIAGVIGGKVGNIDIQTGDGDDNVAVAVANGSAKNINIASGAGIKATNLLLANAAVSGKISVTHTGATETTFNNAYLNSKVGSLEYTSKSGTNTFAFGFDLGSLLSAIQFPGFPGSDPTFSSLDVDPDLDVPSDPVFGGFPPANGLTVTKGIRVVTGEGNDTVRFDGAANVKVGQGIALELGAGDNNVGGSVLNFVTKNLKVTGGAGADTVTLEGTGSLGAVTLDLGAGTNDATLGGGVVPLAIASLSFTSTSAADATDSLTLARIIAAGKVSAKFGEGASTLRIDDSIIGGPFDADTGAGEDVVDIDTGATNAGTVLVKAATIKLGDGDDTLTIGGNGTSSLLTTKATFSADGGTGTNTLNNSGNKYAKDPKFLNFAL